GTGPARDAVRPVHRRHHRQAARRRVRPGPARWGKVAMVGLSVLCGLLVGAGLWLVVTGARRTIRPDQPSTLSWLRHKLTGRTGHRLAAAVAVAAVVATVTRWPVAALLAGLFGYAAPAMFGGGRAEAASLAKLDAIASWTEALRGSLRSYAGVEQA